jgi:hypothetical protein
MLFLLLFGILTTNLAWSPVDAQVIDAEAEVLFQQLIDQTANETPIFGPESGALPYEAYEDCPECTWAAGLSTTDVRVHVELDWQGGSDLPGGLFLAIRQPDPQALDVLAPNFITIMGPSWIAGGSHGELLAPPESVDVVATGNQGLLSINGELVTTFDLTGYSGPGDVVLTAGMMVNYPGGSLGVENFTVWDLADVAPPLDVDAGIPADGGAAQFDTLRLTALTQPLIYGPSSGSLPHDPVDITYQDAGVSVTDFAAHVTCVAPENVFDGLWDCGFTFRNLDSADHYRLVVVSDRTWYLATGSGEAPFASGDLGALPAFEPGSQMTLDLIVSGEEGHLGVNDVFIATFDLSGLPGPGTVAAGTSFLSSTYVEAGVTQFRDFGVVSLDAPHSSTEAQDPPVNDQIDNPIADPPGVAGNTFTDPAFGYSLTWDDAWSVIEVAELDGAPMLRLTNGSVTAEVYGFFTPGNATECVNNLVSFYQEEPGYSNVTYVQSGAGDTMLSEGTDTALGLISMTVTDDQVTQESFDYIACISVVDGQSMMRIEQFVSPDDYVLQLDAMHALQMGFGFNAAADVPEPDLQTPPQADVDPEDITAFSEYLTTAAEQEPMFGPTSGSMEHHPEDVTLVDAGLSVSDFAAHAECEAPAGGVPAIWDCGFYFRDPEDGHFRLAVRSDGDWSLSVGMSESAQSGEGIAALDSSGNRMIIDLVVSGETGYFAVNGNFIDTLHLAEVPGPGTVGVATTFFTDTFADGSATDYTNFTVWSLDEVVPVEAGASSLTGNTYTSPTFGYSLTWDDTWSVKTDTPQDGSDYLSITNGRVTAELTAHTTMSGIGAPACFESLMDKYLSDPAYSNVDIVMNELGQALVTTGETVASALITMTITQEGGPPVELWDYVMCAQMASNNTIVQLEQLVSPGTFMHEQSAMEWLQAGLRVVPEKAVSPPGLPDLSGVVSQPREEDISNFTQLRLTTEQPADIGGYPLTLELDQPSESWWAAGVSLVDVWVRVELPEAPAPGSSSWQFQIEYRAAGAGSDHVVVDSTGAWDAGQVNGTLDQVPSTIDLVALGETGYLAFDGTLVAMLNISTWMQPGDILLSAVSDAGIAAEATFEIADVSVWDMVYDEPPAGATAITYFEEDAAAFPGTLAQFETESQPIFGPVSGTLIHESGMTSFDRSGVAVTNFAARVVCLTPAGGVLWDCGFAVGDLDAADHYRIGIISDGTWFVSQGTEPASLSGPFTLPGLLPGTPLVVDLIVQDGTALLGVNSVYIATLDVADLTGPSNVAAVSAFFGDTAIAGGGVDYDSFTVWSMDEAVPLSSAPTDTDGNTYTSPNYGYSLTWNDSWTVIGEHSEPGFDQLTLTNGSAYADLYSVDLDVDATSCNEDLFAYYSSDSHYSNVAYLLDNAGNPLIVPGSDHASAWIGYTYTDDQGIATEYYDFAICARLPGDSGMVQLELQATPADIDANLAAIEELAMGLSFDQVLFDILDVKSGGGLVEGLDPGNSGGAVTGRGAAIANYDFTVRTMDNDEDD